MAALLLRRDRRTDPVGSVARRELLSTCGVWLGAPKSEGWLASKFGQAERALQVQLGASPAQQLGEYALSNTLLSSASLDQLETELRVRAGDPERARRASSGTSGG